MKLQDKLKEMIPIWREEKKKFSLLTEKRRLVM